MTETLYAPRTDPAQIRAALEHARTHSAYMTHRELGVSYRSICRWLAEADAHDGAWPTPAMDRSWLETRDARAHRNARLASYRARRYLNGGDVLQVDGTGTRRRLRALQAIGWPGWAITLHGPWTAAENIHQLCRRRQRVTRDTHDAVCAIFDLLSMTPGPSDNTRRRAARDGWAPPLAWDDDIDDPKVLPATYLHPVGPATLQLVEGDVVDEAVVLRILAGERILGVRHVDRLEVIRRWDDLGRARNALERSTGWHVYTLLQQEAS